MPGFMEVCSDWELLDMVEGLRHPSTLEKELAKRFRKKLETERAAFEKLAKGDRPTYVTYDGIRYKVKETISNHEEKEKQK